MYYNPPNVSVNPIPDSNPRFREDSYIQYQQSMVATFKKYLPNNFFDRKTVHEMGCGYAYFASYAHQQNARKVFATDAREEHIEVIEKYKPGLESYALDGDDVMAVSQIEPVDIMIHCSLLHYLKNIENHIQLICSKCKYLILESNVCDSNVANNVFYRPLEYSYDAVFHKLNGCFPSSTTIEGALESSGFDYCCIKDPILNTSTRNYTWEIQNTNSFFMESSGNADESIHYSRFWICWRKGEPSPFVNIPGMSLHTSTSSTFVGGSAPAGGIGSSLTSPI